jgi:hypothetical protein
MSGSTHRFIRRCTTAVAAVGVLALCGVGLAAAPASADSDFCGQELVNVDPAQDGLGALDQLLNQGQDSLIQQFAEHVHLGPEVCGPARFAMKVGASIVVGDALLDVYQIKTPWGADVLVGVHDAQEQTQDDTQPTVLPDVGSSAITAPVAWTGGVGLWMNGDPAVESHTILVPEGEQVTLICSASGRTVQGPAGPPSLFDLVSWNGSTGYVADAYLNTGSDQAVVGGC